MIKQRLLYLLLFCFCTWLALATRHHGPWFHPLVKEFGGDVIWSGMFLFFLRLFFTKPALWKLATLNYTLGALIEVSQLYHAPWADNFRQTMMGKLLFGLGFMWSDLVCYATGTILALGVCYIVELYLFTNRKKSQ